MCNNAYSLYSCMSRKMMKIFQSGGQFTSDRMHFGHDSHILLTICSGIPCDLYHSLKHCLCSQTCNESLHDPIESHKMAILLRKNIQIK